VSAVRQLIYKNYQLPRDMGLLTGLFFLTFYYSILISFLPTPRIIGWFGKVMTDKHPASDQDRAVLQKAWRACNFFLNRILRTNKPCLRRTMVLYHWCRKHGVEAKLIVGFYKEGREIKGHSWLLLDGAPFNEDLEELKKYITVLEG
jgi:hypothetical protein